MVDNVFTNPGYNIYNLKPRYRCLEDYASYWTNVAGSDGLENKSAPLIGTRFDESREGGYKSASGIYRRSPKSYTLTDTTIAQGQHPTMTSGRASCALTIGSMDPKLGIIQIQTILQTDYAARKMINGLRGPSQTPNIFGIPRTIRQRMRCTGSQRALSIILEIF